MTASSRTRQDDPTEPDLATGRAPQIFRSFDAKIDGKEFADRIGAYWLEVAEDYAELKHPTRKRRLTVSRHDWEDLRDFEYIRFCTDRFADMLILDVDTDGPGALAPGNVQARQKQLLEMAGAMPVPPSLAGFNPGRGKRSFQMIWLVEKPAFRQGGWERNLHTSVHDALVELYGGDRSFNYSMSRNPLSCTNQQDGYWWFYSDWEPRSWYELNLHYASHAFEEFQPVHEDILEQQARIATANELFEPSRDGRKSKKKEVIMTFDSDGNVNRRQWVFKKSAADASSLMFTGQIVSPETVYPLVLKAAQEAYSIDARLEPLDDGYLRRTAKYVAEWVNREMIPGGGRELRYSKAMSRYTPSQSRLGGLTTSEMHMRSGRWEAEFRPKGPQARSETSAARYAETYNHLRFAAAEADGAPNITQLAERFALSRPTVRKVLREAGLIASANHVAESPVHRPRRSVTLDLSEATQDSARSSRRRYSNAERRLLLAEREARAHAFQAWSDEQLVE